MLLNDEVFDFTDFTSDPMLYSARRGKLRNGEEEEGKEDEEVQERRKGGKNRGRVEESYIPLSL